jgi:ring-1,2-phenylacetyl-CoA epoxidase subunit PaaC
VVRLGDGTDLSRERMQRALVTLWPLAGELFRPDADAAAFTGTATADPGEADAVIAAVLAAAGLERPNAAALAAAPFAVVAGRAGRDGVHTEAMGYILAELQSVARAYPDATW